MNRISSVTDSPRPGQANRVVTSQAIVAVEAIAKENGRVTLNKIAAHLNMSHGSAHHIVHDVLHFHKVFSKLRDKKHLSFSCDSPSYKCPSYASWISGTWLSRSRVGSGSLSWGVERPGRGAFKPLAYNPGVE